MNKQSDKNTVIVARNIVKQLEMIRKSLPAEWRSPDIQPGRVYRTLHQECDRQRVAGRAHRHPRRVRDVRNIRSASYCCQSGTIVATFIAMYFSIFPEYDVDGGSPSASECSSTTSIVILENIFRFREEGAAHRGRKAGRRDGDGDYRLHAYQPLCIHPVFFYDRLAGQLFRQMALTITFSQLCSLLVALTLIPMMTSRFIRSITIRHTGRTAFLNTVFAWSEDRFTRIEAYYSNVIRWALAHRRRVVVYTGIAVVAGIALIPLAGMEFMPEQIRTGNLHRQTFGRDKPRHRGWYAMVDSGYRKSNRAVPVVSMRRYGGLPLLRETTTRRKIEDRYRFRSRLLEHDIRSPSGAMAAPGVTFNFWCEPGTSPERGTDLDRGTATISTRPDYAFRYRAITGIPGLRRRDKPEARTLIEVNNPSKMGLNASYIASLINTMCGGLNYRYEEGIRYFRPPGEEDRKNPTICVTHGPYTRRRVGAARHYHRLRSSSRYPQSARNRNAWYSSTKAEGAI